MRLTPAVTGAAAAVAMGAVYVATLAPDITFWDSGELVAAVESLGIPHPPGMPLYVIAGRAASTLLPWLSRAAAVNLLSALTTAAAVGVIAVLLTRWLSSPWMGFAGAVAAGATSTVWRNATEAEVYAPAMLVSLVALWAADRGAREQGDARVRWLSIAAFLLGLAVPLHLGVLVIAPAVAARAALGTGRDVRWGDALLIAGCATLSTAIGRGSTLLLALGAICIGAAATIGGSGMRTVLAAIGATILAWSAVLFVPIRAAHDPAVNTGFATTWQGLQALLARTQYDVPGLWPRQAPLWIQIANWFEYADWQFALGLGSDVAPTAGRTLVTVVFAVLGVVGVRAHWRRDRASALVLAVLFASTSLGLILYMNFKAGASFGYGVLPDATPHEARDRDYFFALGFAAWGMWAGIGLVAAAASRVAVLAPPAALLAALPVALNWPAVTRARQPDASLPRTTAAALLWSAPPRAILIAGGDNDAFPLWYEQIVHGARLDVRVVVAPLLGAEWYRAELARRDTLLLKPMVARFAGERPTLTAIDSMARSRDRPVALTLAATDQRWLIPARERAIRGALIVRAPGTIGVWVPDAAAVLDTAALRQYEQRFAATLAASPPVASVDPTSRVMHALLRCPLEMRRVATSRAASLAPPCSFR